jgi:hypothetical protein
MASEVAPMETIECLQQAEDDLMVNWQKYKAKKNAKSRSSLVIQLWYL